jgi:ribonuclease-3
MASCSRVLDRSIMPQDPLDSSALEELEARLGHRFADRGLARTALTHRSLAHERSTNEHYERLEFLGDAVLGLVTSEWLYRRYPESPEGELARRKSYLVSAPVLADFARKICLGDLLRLGMGEERSGGRDKTSLLADSIEAVFGAVFLDGNLAAARRVVQRFLEQAGVDHPEAVGLDAKTRLQELLQARGWELPEYRLVGESGPDHRKTFRVECRVQDRVVASGEGPSKKLAEQRAAAGALDALDRTEVSGG